MSANYGFEIELFATDNKRKHVLNATRLINDFLKLDKFPNFRPSGLPVLLNASDFSLIADGTPFEIVGKKTACEDSMLGKNPLAPQTINEYLTKIRQYISEVFTVDTVLIPYVNSPEWEFSNPQQVYSSGKRMHHAYSNTSDFAEKKESNKSVTFRSVGFHIHIRFDENVEKKMFEGIYAPIRCNGLIKELDKVYLKHFPECLSKISSALVIQEQLRNTHYAKLGDYRIKYHHLQPSFQTLEYRQFSAAFFLLDVKTQQKILHDFANTVRKFTRNLLDSH